MGNAAVRGDAIVPKTIVIIGGGFSGAALAAYLLRSGSWDLKVVIVEPRAKLGGGIAHDDAAPNHILNVTADRMSLWSDQPFSFLDWSRLNGAKLGWPKAGAARDQTYLPRQLFGQYVEAELSRLIELGQPTFKHHQSTASAVMFKDGAFQVTLDTGATVDADIVVLATGFRPPSVPFPVKGSGVRFVSNPWQAGVLDAVGPRDDVLLVGTGLTMVDMVYSLEHAGHIGKITALSRHGFLPRIHDHSNKQAPIITYEDASKGIVHTLRKFRRSLATGRSDWRTAVDALRPIIDELWMALPPGDQDRFLRHLRPLWEVHRHRMPAESADLLFKRIGQGRLEIVAARILDLNIGQANVEVEYLPRYAKTTLHRKFHWVINCTPPAPPLAAGADQLTESLVQAGLVREHRSGLGFDVDVVGRALNADSKPNQRLFVLGPPRRGHAVEATAIPHIRPQLDALSRTVLNQLQS